MTSTLPFDPANCQVPQIKSKRFRWVGTSAWMAVTLLLLVSNGLTLLDRDFRNKAHGLVTDIAASQMLQTLGLTSILPALEARSSAALEKKAVQHATAHLVRSRAILEQEIRSLRSERVKLLTAHHILKNQLQVSQVAILRHKHRIAKLGERVLNRAARSVARRMAALPGHALPGLSATVAVGSAILDIDDACESLKDLDDLNRSVGFVPAKQTEVCGHTVPSAESLLKSAQDNWRQAYNNSADALNKASSQTRRTGSELIPKLQPGVSFNYAQRWFQSNLGQ